jgi:hypothetical protein
MGMAPTLLDAGIKVGNVQPEAFLAAKHDLLTLYLQLLMIQQRIEAREFAAQIGERRRLIMFRPQEGRQMLAALRLACDG